MHIMNNIEQFTQLRKGLLEFVVLTVIARNRVYVAELLLALADTMFATQEGTLYPLLSKLRREGQVDYEWVESESGPPRKYYSLTPKGKAFLKEINAHWHEINTTIKQL